MEVDSKESAEWSDLMRRNSALEAALSALSEDQKTAPWQNAPHDLLRRARALLSNEPE